MRQHPARAVIAIDFGTSRSGFAYAFTVDRKVIGWTDWPGQSTAYPKTLTHLLYGPGREVVAWGFPAAPRWAELVRRGETSGYHFFRAFKMELHTSHQRGERGPILYRPGESFVVLDLVADYLRQMKAMAWSNVHEATGGHLREEEVTWCLTVPAIWADAEKRLMRVAAQEAGLIGEDAGEADRLLLVLEPEAAAIHCQEKDSQSLPPGTRFMIVDCGGGTVDITSHELVEGEGMKEVAPGTGGALGSGYVDQVFMESFLREKLGADLLDTYRSDEPLDFLEMMADWERLKCNFDPDNALGASFLPFRPRLYRLMVQRFPEVYERLEDAGHEDGLAIEPEEMAGIFAPVLDGIVDKVREELDNMQPEGCEVLFLVGGFSASPLLERRIRDTFGDAVGRIVVPPVPGAAVVEGAVSFGLEPALIRARRSRLTYGCDVDRPFEPGVDSEGRKVWDPETEMFYCTDRFKPFVQAGDVVEIEKSVSEVFYPADADQTEILLDFYATRHTDVRYIDEAGVEKIGRLRIEMPDISGGVEREVEVTMYFGKTEIEVAAVDQTSGHKCLTTLSFTPTFSGELLDEAVAA